MALRIATIAASAAAASSAAPMFSTYLGNWVEYHTNGYAFTPDLMAPIVPALDSIIYAFLYFCPPPGTVPMPYWAVPPYGSCSDASAFQITSVDPHDAPYMSTLTGFKSINPKLKVTVSVGGWDFPSAYFSAMARNASSRATFVASLAAAVAQYGADGVDIDWEYPCSPGRSDPVEITCSDFQTVPDAGGSCPDDSDAIVALFALLRSTLGPTSTITVASQAARSKEAFMHIGQLAPYVDRMNIMTYDYTVSDVTTPTPMSPNAPLYTPAPPATEMSVNDTVMAYIGAGVPRSKIHVGLPLYGHTWFNPNLEAGGAWKKFGATPVMQGTCCGPFQPTYGASPGQGANQCGLYMISEIAAALGPNKAGGLYTYDNATQSAIAYFTQQGADGYTAAGTWITYNDETSARAFAAYVKSMGLGGMFVFDASMDTIVNGQFTFGTMNAIAAALK